MLPDRPQDGTRQLDVQRMPARSIEVQGPGVDAVEAVAPDLGSLLKALRRRWFLALASGSLLAAAGAAAAWNLIPPAPYTARSMLHVSSQPSRLIFDTNEREARYVIYQKTQERLIKSRVVLEAALNDPRVAELDVIRTQVHPLSWLEKGVSVRFPRYSEILEISMSGDDPAALATLVNAVSRSYMSEIVEVERQQRLDRQKMLRDLYQGYQETLKSRREALRALADTAGTDSREVLTQQQLLSREQIAQSRRELLSLQADIRRTEIELAFLVEKRRNATIPDVSIPESMIDEYVARDDTVQSYKAYISRIEADLERVQRVVKKQADPAITHRRSELEKYRRVLADFEAELRPKLAAEIGKQSGDRLTTRQVELNDRLALMKSNEKFLLDLIGSMDKESRVLGRATMDLQSIQDEIALIDSNAVRVGSEVEALNVELMAPPRIRLVQEADIPREPGASKRAKMTGAAVVGSFAVALLGISFWEFRLGRINDVAEVNSKLRMKLVGTVPAIDEAPRAWSIGGRGRRRQHLWSDEHLESVDTLRTMLLHASRVGSFRTVMVTSALKGEGKTSLSGHLGLSLARAGRKTLLIDCDLRSPALHRLFDLIPEPGLSDVLRGEVDPAEVIWPTAVEGLSVMPAGRCDPAALRGLASQRLKATLDRFGDRFDLIVVDTAPALLVSDTLLVGQQVEAALFSVLRDISRAPRVREAHDRIADIGTPILGAVVSGTYAEHYGYSYGYRRGRESAAGTGVS